MLLRRSARNAKSSSTKDTATTQRKARKHPVQCGTSQIDGGSESKRVSAPLKGTTRNTKDGGRIPLSSMQTTEAIEKPQNNVFVEVVKLVKPTADKTPLLKEFMEDPDVTLDIPDVEVDPKAAERVASWQARSSPPPIPASRRLPFSSSLPPSSPLPPLPQDPSLDNFEFNPPSPQQEDNFLDADVSYESNISDDFGFFAAQSRIHAKMDRERNLNADKRGTRRRSADAADTTLEISFSGRPAFATPYVQHRKTSMSSQDLEDITSSKQIQPGAGNDETSSPGPRAHRGRERPRARSRQNRGRRNGKIDVSKRSRVAQDRVKKPLSTKPLGNLGGRAPRKASGSSAGQSRVKKTTRVSVGIEESDIEFADSEEEGDPREASEQAKKQRIAEFEALGDYELEVEDVIVF